MRVGTRDAERGMRQGLVLGLGASGVSALGYLQSRGWKVSATDDRPDRKARAGAAWCPPETAVNSLDAIDMLVVSPGVPLDTPLVSAARQHGIEVLGDVELFARAVTVPVIAVTGTNGKSTVCSLVAAMACAAGRITAVGANFGTPALDLIDPQVALYVLELSSFQLELTHSLAPLVATVLNVSDDHLDRHGSIEAYVDAKARIYAHSRIAVVNRDDARVMAMPFGHARRIGFGLDAPPTPSDYGLREAMLYRGEQPLLAASEVPLSGRHNLANVLAAWALAAAAGVDDAAIARAVRAFRPLVHRLTPAGEHAGVSYLDDSKATNVSAAMATLAGLDGPLVVIAGGQGKGQDFTAFAAVLAERARAVILLGVDAPLIARALAGRIPVVQATTMEQAVAEAARCAQPGDRVVLAPACASFDLFDNYGARGDAFVRAVAAFDDC